MTLEQLAAFLIPNVIIYMTANRMKGVRVFAYGNICLGVASICGEMLANNLFFEELLKEHSETYFFGLIIKFKMLPGIIVQFLLGVRFILHLKSPLILE